MNAGWNGPQARCVERPNRRVPARPQCGVTFVRTHPGNHGPIPFAALAPGAPQPPVLRQLQNVGRRARSLARMSRTVASTGRQLTANHRSFLRVAVARRQLRPCSKSPMAKPRFLSLRSLVRLMAESEDQAETGGEDAFARQLGIKGQRIQMIILIEQIQNSD